MRAEGTVIATYTPSSSPPPERPKKPSNWRKNHEKLIANIRARKDNSQQSHAFQYSDDRYSAKYSGSVYSDVHLQTHQANTRAPQEAIQLVHNT